MALKVIFEVFVLVICMNCVLSEFNLTIVHITDFHSHWFEFNENKLRCSEDESKEGKCFGGFPRLLSFVRDLRRKEKNVLVLSTGEFFVTRTLNAMHGWKPAHDVLQKLDLDAMSLANHDFKSGIFQLSVFLYGQKFPVLCANMKARNTSYIYSRVNKSVVLDIGGEKVGIVGYIDQHALTRSYKGAASIKFLPEIPALQEEVRRLEEEEGVNKIIALGHAGYYRDLQIAKKVKGVDIIIGGGSDIMLFDPGNDEDESVTVGNIHRNYPRVHHQYDEDETENNDASLVNRTLVLHIPRHGMYVGVLRATFDSRGKIIHESGEPVLLNSSIPQDENILDFLYSAEEALEEIVEHSRLPYIHGKLGEAQGVLDGEPRNCRTRECSLGNFIADAMLYEFTWNYRNNSDYRYRTERWGPIDALVINSGMFLHSIKPGPFTLNDMLYAVILGGFVRRVYMSGQQLINMMEHSVSNYDPRGIHPPGAFLQVAGLKVEYDLSKNPGSRVRSLLIRCRDCDDETYLPVKYFKTYVIGMPNFMKIGGDGFYEFEDVDEIDQGQFDALLVVENIQRTYYVNPKLDGRIKFHHADSMQKLPTPLPNKVLYGLQMTTAVPNAKDGIPSPSETSESQSTEAVYIHDVSSEKIKTDENKVKDISHSMTSVVSKEFSIHNESHTSTTNILLADDKSNEIELDYTMKAITLKKSADFQNLSAVNNLRNSSHEKVFVSRTDMNNETKDTTGKASGNLSISHPDGILVDEAKHIDNNVGEPNNGLKDADVLEILQTIFKPLFNITENNTSSINETSETISGVLGNLSSLDENSRKYIHHITELWNSINLTANNITSGKKIVPFRGIGSYDEFMQNVMGDVIRAIILKKNASLKQSLASDRTVMNISLEGANKVVGQQKRLENLSSVDQTFAKYREDDVSVEKSTNLTGINEISDQATTRSYADLLQNIVEDVLAEILSKNVSSLKESPVSDRTINNASPQDINKGGGETKPVNNLKEVAQTTVKRQERDVRESNRMSDENSLKDTEAKSAESKGNLKGSENLSATEAVILAVISKLFSNAVSNDTLSKSSMPHQEEGIKKIINFMESYFDISNYMSRIKERLNDIWHKVNLDHLHEELGNNTIGKKHRH